MTSRSHLKPLTYRQRAELFGQLAALEKAGIPAMDALRLLRLDRASQTLVKATLTHLKRGLNLADAAQLSGLFNDLETSLIRAAQTAGSPASMYQKLADQYSRQHLIAGTLKSKLALPILIFIFAVAIQPLPQLVNGTISSGHYVASVLLPLAFIGIILQILGKQLSRIGQGDLVLGATASQLLLKLPVFGDMHRRRNVSDYCAALSLLIEAGVPMFEALPYATASINNLIIRSAAQRAEDETKKGTPLSTALAVQRHVFDQSLIALIVTGEASGRLPDMLKRFSSSEADAIKDFQQNVADWLPRLLYTVVAAWIAYGIITGPGITAGLPRV